MASIEPAVGRLEQEFAGQLESLQRWFKDALDELQAEQNGGQPLAPVVGAPGRASAKPPTEKPPPAANGKDARAIAQEASTASLAIEVSETAMPGRARRSYPMRQVWQEGAEHNDRHATRSAYRSTSSKASNNLEHGSQLGMKNCHTTLPLHPHSTPRMVWDLLAAVCLLFDFVTVPLGAFGPPNSLVKAGGLFVLVYWTLDVFVNCISSYLNRDGTEIRSYRMIIKRYALTWLAPDATVVILEWMTVLAESIDRSVIASYRGLAKCFRAARLVRLLRLLRLAKVRELLCKLEEKIDSEWVSIAWGVCCNVVVLLMLNHVFACAWFLVGEETRASGHESWVLKYDVHNAPFVDQYIISLHWSLTQFTPASMAVQPQNSLERTFAVSTLLMAMIMFSTFVSSVTAGMTRLRNLQASQLYDMYTLRKFMHAHHITPGLSARVFRYIAIVMQARKKVLPRSSVRLLQYLSGPLNIELLAEMYWPQLEKHPYFTRCYNDHTCGILCSVAIDLASASASDLIFSRAGKASHFYLLASGTMAYRVKGSKRASRHLAIRVPQGSWFTEAALWVNWYHQGTMRALTECQLMQVDVGKFADATLSHIKVAEETRAYAHEFVQALNDSVQELGRAWDLPDAVARSLGLDDANLSRSATKSTIVLDGATLSEGHSLSTAELREISKAEVFELRMMSDSSEDESEREASTETKRLIELENKGTRTLSRAII